VRAFPAGLSSSPSRFVAALVATVWWLAQPPSVWFYYHAQYRRGAYPPDGDAIMIPIAQLAILWALVTPFVATALVIALRRYRAGQSYVAFDTTRRLSSTLWSAFFGIVALIIAEVAYYDAWDGYPLLALARVPGLLVLAWVRSSVCAPRAQGASPVVEPTV
jgi:hypothetical protein